MRKVAFSHFRRNPAFAIEKRSRFLAKIYRAADFGSFLSDFIADPAGSIRPYLPAILNPKPQHTGPLVSVIVATRNNEGTIERSVCSLLNQTYRNLEIIVVDDASNDRSVDVIKALSESDNRIELRQNFTRFGTGRSRNIGLDLAKGQYITFQDGDDISLPTRVQIQLSALTGNPQKKFCLCNYVRVDDADQTLEVNNKRVMKCIISIMFPRSVVSDVGGFSDSSISEDSDYYERIKAVYGKATEVIAFQTLYRALYRPDSSFFSKMENLSFDGRRITYHNPLIPDGKLRK